MKRLVILVLAIGLWVSPIDAKCGFITTKRTTTVRLQFMKQTGYPHGRPGYIIDHIIPLCKGGPDIPANMQWQTKAASKAKDRVECKCSVTK